MLCRLRPPVREGCRRAEVGHPAGAGQLIPIGGNPLQDRGGRGLGDPLLALTRRYPTRAALLWQG